MGCTNSREGEQPAVAQDKETMKAAAREYMKRQKVCSAELVPLEQRAAEWARIKKQLPTDRSEEAKKVRDDLFKQWDFNGNNMLSLAEIDKACREQLALDRYTSNLAPILLRAYFASCNVANASDREGFVEKREFRILIGYIVYYFDLMTVYEKLDTSADRRVSREEFVSNAPKLREFGLTLNDPAATFSVLDTNNGGFVLFEEFADWAATQKLFAEEPQQGGK